MDKLLLLEDDVALIDGLTYSLRKQGYEIDIVRTVSEALALLPGLSQYALLLWSGLVMPDRRSRARMREHSSPSLKGLVI